MSAKVLGRKWYEGTLILILVLVVGRLILELAGADHAWTRYLSSSAALFLAAIYLGSVAPLRGVTRFSQLILPAIILGAWTAGWVIVVTLFSAVFRLERSHYAEAADYGNWSHLGRHLFDHTLEIPILAVLVLILMTVPYVLRRWPAIVGPAAVLGGLVIIRFWAEAMDVSPARAAAWSSTVAVLLSALYLGGVGRHMGITSAGQLFVPAIVLGWVWRFWVFLAAVLTALIPFYRTHFFDVSEGRVGIRLLQLLAGGLVEGFIAGVIVWGIAVWIAGATRPAATA